MAPAAAGPSTAGSMPPLLRTTALWVWDSADHDGVLALADRQQVDTLLVAVGPNINTRPVERAQVVRLVTSAHRLGLRVEAVGGAPDWGRHTAWVLQNWLRPTLALAPFDAVQLDVEPYLEPSWLTNRTAATAEFLTMLRAVRRASRVQVHAAIPFWFDQVPGGSGRSLAHHVAALCPQVTIMAYRTQLDGPNGLIALATGTLREVRAAGGTALVGIETRVVEEDPHADMLTFAGLGPEAVAAALADVRQHFADPASPVRPAFAGVAVHDAYGWAALGG